jgi:hypothetical protein
MRGMAKDSSAKKVERAARVGGSGGVREGRNLAFPLLVAAIIVVGIASVVIARTTRDAQAQPTLQDHWHIPYGVWDCQAGDFLDPFQSEFDPFGIHSHQDGLIHVHPFTAGVTGREAKLSVFMDAMGAVITDDELTLPGGEALSAGVECDGEPAVLQIVRWDDAFNPGDPSEVVTDDLSDFPFLDDAQAITIALAPLGADIPLPESLDTLASVYGQDRDEGIEPPNDVDVPGPQDFGTGTAPGDADADSTDEESDGEG